MLPLAQAYSKEKKVEVFEYIVHGLINWFKGSKKIANNKDFNNNNDLNKLKILKLHFFVTAAKEENNHLLDVFNNFSAMPYGHVESDIYNALDHLDRYEISNYSLTIKNVFIDSLSDSFNSLEELLKADVDSSILLLKKINDFLILYTSFQLVELSHTWFSWRSMFNMAKSRNKLSESIPTKLIREEHKNFKLAY